MQILPISHNNKKQSFGFNFKLSPKTISAFEKSTGLSYNEMTSLPLSESTKLMKERGTLKEPNKLFLWMQEKYKQFGEKTGLLKKEHNFYTDID